MSDPHLASDDAVLTIPVTVTGGTVASYEMNGNVNDTAGTQSGTAAGGPVYGNGRHDRAILFDGVNDVVTLPAGVASHPAITIATRFRWNGTGASWQRVFDFGNNTNQYLFLSPNGGSMMRFAIKNGGAEQILEAPAPAPGEWVHVAVTLGAGTGRLYVNGALAATGPITITPSQFNPAINYLGDSMYAADPFFNGAIDDLTIHDRVLSAAEVFQLAIQNYGISGGGIAPIDTPYAAWKFQYGFTTGTDGHNDDPDHDGVVNLMEYLLGSHPLTPGTDLLPQAGMMAGPLLGMAEATDKHYLSFQARVRKDRAGVTLVPQAAATIEGLTAPDASGNVIQAGPPVTDGDFDVFTWYYPVAVEDSLAGKGFMRLTVVPE
ncbi:MAG: LamG domain-containing protein [Verrucomicrobiaceae bacterium]|nr:MAG: LamG domain-containing protein [Verrucomicrobiaceae bacterium]